MTELHPLTFARTVSMRLSGIQNRLDRLEDLLPLSELSADARRELRALQERLLDLILDKRSAALPMRSGCTLRPSGRSRGT